jgi:hypothetical protein
MAAIFFSMAAIRPRVAGVHIPSLNHDIPPTSSRFQTASERSSLEMTPLAGLVIPAKLRWRIERDLREVKRELGFGHPEGRGWRGFHHDATLCIAAYGFQICERETIPPRYSVPPRTSKNLPFPLVVDPEAPPIRPERHIPNSIATLRRRLTVALALARNLDRCPCCQTPRTPPLNQPRLSRSKTTPSSAVRGLSEG